MFCLAACMQAAARRRHMVVDPPACPVRAILLRRCLCKRLLVYRIHRQGSGRRQCCPSRDCAALLVDRRPAWLSRAGSQRQLRHSPPLQAGKQGCTAVSGGAQQTVARAARRGQAAPPAVVASSSSSTGATQQAGSSRAAAATVVRARSAGGAAPGFSRIGCSRSTWLSASSPAIKAYRSPISCRRRGARWQPAASGNRHVPGASKRSKSRQSCRQQQTRAVLLCFD